MLLSSEVLLIGSFAGAISLLSLLVWARISPDPDQSIWRALREAEAETVFLFDGESLVDCTPPAKRFMDGIRKDASDLVRFRRSLEGRFSTLPSLGELGDGKGMGRFRADDPEDHLELRLEAWSGFTRATLTRRDDDEDDHWAADGSPARRDDELSSLRMATEETSVLMWQADDEGQITWANEAYLQKIEDCYPGKKHQWPPIPLFPAVQHRQDTTGKLERLELKVENETQTFDVSAVDRDGFRFFSAFNADAVVQADTARREFIQTLTKTFAQLSIGLAIFDRSRKLALFNPALLDLMGLPAEFLSQQPSLTMFLDRLRAENRIAEPKNYRAWRAHLVELEARAADGSYCETWNLPGGVTYRVTGRPHPDGAIAFLFEDISAEISLTRRFHAEIDLGHAALDAMDEAVLVINGGGVISFTNQAYRDLWKSDPDSGLIVSRLEDVSRGWKQRVKDMGGLDRLLAAISENEKRSGPWRGLIQLQDDRYLRARVHSLKGGATMVAFAPASLSDTPDHRPVPRHAPPGVAAS